MPMSFLFRVARAQFRAQVGYATKHRTDAASGKKDVDN